MIERQNLCGNVMAQPSFPCFAWQCEPPVEPKVLLPKFLELRPDSQWVLIGEGCAQSNLQLWTAWNCASRRWLRSTALARSLDAEFLRYLSGIHHVSEAFKRAGMRRNDTAGYLLYLPNTSNTDKDQADCSPIDFDATELEMQAISLLDNLKLETKSFQYELSKEGAIRLGVRFENDQEQLTEQTLIGHIISAEFTS